MDEYKKDSVCEKTEEQSSALLDLKPVPNNEEVKSEGEKKAEQVFSAQNSTSEKEKKNGKAVASMVLGIVALVTTTCCCCMAPLSGLIGLILSGIGLALGIVAIVGGQKKGFSLTGIILCGLSIFASLANLLVGGFMSEILEIIYAALKEYDGNYPNPYPGQGGGMYSIFRMFIK